MEKGVCFPPVFQLSKSVSGHSSSYPVIKKAIFLYANAKNKKKIIQTPKKSYMKIKIIKKITRCF